MNIAAILTRHNIPNYGSLLQAYATEVVLKRLGWNPLTIDYRRSDEGILRRAWRYSKGAPPSYKAFYLTAWPVLYSTMQLRFRGERERLLTLSERCSSKDIWTTVPQVDAYLTGSDQVWNVVGEDVVDGAFFWEGIEKGIGQRIVSYAASFGSNELIHGYEGDMAKWLSRYDAISVREDSGVALVAECGCEATQVVDPTLLLSAGDWALFARGGEVPSRPYALVYNLHRHSDMLSSVKRDVEGSGLEVVSLCPTFRPRLGRHIFLPSSAEFVALFRGASRVYTDSFHGSAFSINFGVPFISFPPNENSERIRSLLRLFALENRLWNEQEQCSWAEDAIDRDAVDKKLNDERARSFNWLKTALGGGVILHVDCLDGRIRLLLIIIDRSTSSCIEGRRTLSLLMAALCSSAFAKYLAYAKNLQQSPYSCRAGYKHPTPGRSVWCVLNKTYYMLD